MKKWLITSVIVLFSIVSLINPINCNATDWVRLSANEVIGGAEVVVQGIYDLSEFDLKMSDSRMRIPFKFKVYKYYKGSGSNNIDTAIQPFDMGWVREFQDKNGVFILFLKRDPQGRLIPVGGPNGMVQILNGTIQNQNPANIEAYKEFLRSQALVTSPLQVDNSSSILAGYWFIFALVLVVGVLQLLRWFTIKRKSK